jgi:hypothetical protein
MGRPEPLSFVVVGPPPESGTAASWTAAHFRVPPCILAIHTILPSSSRFPWNATSGELVREGWRIDVHALLDSIANMDDSTLKRIENDSSWQAPFNFFCDGADTTSLSSLELFTKEHCVATAKGMTFSAPADSLYRRRRIDHLQRQIDSIVAL